eukprot:2828696-Prymnesium_polylepis.1
MRSTVVERRSASARSWRSRAMAAGRSRARWAHTTKSRFGRRPRATSMAATWPAAVGRDEGESGSAL